MAFKIFAMTFFCACAFQVIGRFLFNYDVKDGKIRVLLFCVLPVYLIKIDETLEAEELPLIRTIKPKFSRVNLNNRFVGRVVEIRKNRGLVRCLSLTPDDPVSFLRQVRYAQALNPKTTP